MKKQGIKLSDLPYVKEKYLHSETHSFLKSISNAQSDNKSTDIHLVTV